jgi:NADP-dependent aldehyde dehydrogenase
MYQYSVNARRTPWLRICDIAMAGCPESKAGEQESMVEVNSINPRTGTVLRSLDGSSSGDVDAACSRAAAAAPALEALGRSGRASMLRMMAGAFESRRDEVIGIADLETGLGIERLNGELSRTTFQMRLFADVLDDGSYLEATIDHPGATASGPRPDLRRMLVPIGPVAVFGASNFPLAFSTPGGDTVSALAAGCPVLIKAHDSHPSTSNLCADVLRGVVRDVGLPNGTACLLHGQAAGAQLVTHPAVRAVGFTGSSTAGRALLDLIGRRPDPIPLYGELASLNPVVVTERAAQRRGSSIALGLTTSFTTAGGQMCTKPGLIFIAVGDAGDRTVTQMREHLQDAAQFVLLNERIRDSFAADADALRSGQNIHVVHATDVVMAEGFYATALEVAAAELNAEAYEEHFGPVAIVARYRDEDELLDRLGILPGSLTATIHSEPADAELAQAITTVLRPRAGRLVYDEYPTGVAVSWAQHHGGPWPSSNTTHSSVGPTAIRRFLRPLAWQNSPEHVLPLELREDYLQIPRRIDGQLKLAPQQQSGVSW